MSVTVTDPSGAKHTTRQGASPIQFTISGPAGLYKAIVRGIDLPKGGEPYTLAFATNSPCAEGNVDEGGFVRQTISNDQIAAALRQSGVTLQVQGTSPNSARIFYYSELGAVPLSWTILFYAASPNLGFVLTQVTVRGVNVTTGVVSRLTSFSATKPVA